MQLGKYSKVEEGGVTPTPSDYDDASTTSSDLSDIEEFDPLNYDAGSLKRTRPRKGGLKRKIADFDNPNRRKVSFIRRWLIPSRMTCFLILLFVGSTVMLLSAGGIWAWKMAPEDGQSPPWYPTPLGGADKSWEKSYSKAAALVRQMTLVEKVNVTTGAGWQMNFCVGNTGPVHRLGFPSLCLQDGPLGIRMTNNITIFPAGVTVGATWNRDLMYKRGRAHAAEARGKGVNVLLGPAMGPIGRTPLGGRVWEGFGADPVLQGIAAAETIKGIQDEGVIATAKHYVGNEQEHYRQSWEWGIPNGISSNIDDRTMHEIYAWPFADSVRAGVASIMCSYNQVNNSYACGNSLLLNGILKDELGFQGFVQSDWLAQRSGVGSALAGLDMSMPGDGLRWMDGKTLWGGELTKAVLNSSVPLERLNDMVTRIVAAWYQLGQDDKTKYPHEGPNFSSWTKEKVGFIHHASGDKAKGVVNHFVDVQGSGKEAHGNLVRTIGAEGTVLLKNEGNLLPLNRNGVSQSAPKPRADKELKVRIGIFGEDSDLNKDGINSCQDRACNIGTLAQGWGSGAAEYPYLIAPLAALQREFSDDKVHVTSFASNKIPGNQQDELLGTQDICFAFVSADSGEGFTEFNGAKGDRNHLHAEKGGDDLVKTVAKNCGKGSGSTIVVIHAVGAIVVEDWIDLPGVKAVIHAQLPGQESGNSLADIIFGDVNPSGRLPYTIGKSLKDYGDAAKILRIPNGIVPQQNFSEGLYFDYRHFDKNNITPRFEFGFGLSYTTWELSNLVIESKEMRKNPLPAPRPDPGVHAPTYDNNIPDPKDAVFPESIRKLKNYIYPYINSVSEIVVGKYPYPAGWYSPRSPSPAGGAQGGNPDLYTVFAEVRATLTNTGDRDGATVVQLYISYPAGYVDDETGEPIDFPVKVLRGFQKPVVRGGKHKAEVTFQLTRRDLSYWCVRRQNWILPIKGDIKIQVGFSSRDLPLKGNLVAL